MSHMNGIAPHDIPPEYQYDFNQLWVKNIWRLCNTWITYYHPKPSFYFLLICTFVFLKVVEIFVVFFEAQLCFFKKGVNFLSYTFVCLKMLKFYILLSETHLFFCWKVVHVGWVRQNTLTRKNQCKSFFGLPHPRFKKNVCKVNITTVKRRNVLKLSPNIEEYTKNPCCNK